MVSIRAGRLTFLLEGRQGSGKRFLASALAREIGHDFIEINLGVMSRAAPLVGSPHGDVDVFSAKYLNDSLRLLDNESGCLIYLSDLEATDPRLQQLIHTLVTKRRFYDQSGVLQAIPEHWIIVGGYEINSIVTEVHADGWLLSAFPEKVRLLVDEVEAGLPLLVEHFARERNHDKECTASNAWLADLTSGSQDGLSALRRWTEKVLSTNPSSSIITKEDLLHAAMRDLHYLTARIRFRGRPVSESRVHRWTSQFPEMLRPMALHVFREIANRYYIDDTKYYPALEALIHSTLLRPNARVRFCRWQQSGRSSPRVAHLIKNQAAWKLLDDVNLDDPKSWPKPDSLPTNLILVDDYSGSGRTLSRLWDGGRNSIVEKLAETYRGGRLRILVVTAFESAVQKIRALARAQRGFVSIEAAILLSDKDRCFSRESRIFPNVKQREFLRAHCEKLAEEKFPSLKEKDRLGFEGVGALTVFSDIVPNNTIPAVWYDQSSVWIPLFPASGLLDAT